MSKKLKTYTKPRNNTVQTVNKPKKRFTWSHWVVLCLALFWSITGVLSLLLTAKDCTTYADSEVTDFNNAFTFNSVPLQISSALYANFTDFNSISYNRVINSAPIGYELRLDFNDYFNNNNQNAFRLQYSIPISELNTPTYRNTFEYVSTSDGIGISYFQELSSISYLKFQTNVCNALDSGGNYNLLTRFPLTLFTGYNGDYTTFTVFDLIASNFGPVVYDEIYSYFTLYVPADGFSSSNFYKVRYVNFVYTQNMTGSAFVFYNDFDECFLLISHRINSVGNFFYTSDLYDYVRYTTVTVNDDVVTQNAYRDGYNVGYDEGNQNGFRDGYNTGYNEGEINGYNNGVESANEYTFLGLLGAVVDAPVSVLVSVLNFDILGFNMANFFFGLLTLAIIIFVVKLIL